MKHDDPYTVQSPWGAVAGFFLIQCFGYVILHGFRMFVNIGVNGSDSLNVFNAYDWVDRFFLLLWGLMWISAFVAFEVDVIRRIATFWHRQSIQRFLHALRTPSEAIKAILAILFALGFLALGVGYYPFPKVPIPTVVSILFWLFGWGVSGLIAWSIRHKTVQEPEAQEGSVAGSILGFAVGSVFFAIAYFLQPGVFYFHGMIGLGVVTMVTCQFLFRAF